MPVYEFKCRDCGVREDSHTPVVGDASCLECGGPLQRVWKVNIATVPGGYKEANRGR